MLESPTEAGLSCLDEFLAGHGVHLGGDTVPKCIELLLHLDRPGLVGYKLFRQSPEPCGPHSKEDRTVSDVHVSCRLRVVHCLQLEERELDLEGRNSKRAGRDHDGAPQGRRRGMQLDAAKPFGRATRTEQGDSLSRQSVNIDSSLAELSCRSIFLSGQKPSVAAVVSQLPLACLSSCRCSLPPSVLGLCSNT